MEQVEVGWVYGLMCIHSAFFVVCSFVLVHVTAKEKERAKERDHVATTQREGVADPYVYVRDAILVRNQICDT